MSNEENWFLPNATMAMLLLSIAIETGSGNINKISERLAYLKNKKIDIGDITISKVASGYYSEQLDRFLGSLLVTGNATKRSPIKLEESGVELCKEIINEACMKDYGKLKDIAQTIDFDLSQCKMTIVQSPV